MVSALTFSVTAKIYFKQIYHFIVSSVLALGHIVSSAFVIYLV